MKSRLFTICLACSLLVSGCTTVGKRVVKSATDAKVHLYYSQPPNLIYREVCYIELTGLRLERLLAQLEVVAEQAGANAVINVHSQRLTGGARTVTGVAVITSP